jgi:hypothetical protein
MTTMKRSVVTALIVALPVELVNFFVFPFPIDVGLPDNAGWFEKFIGLQWVILHWPGLWLTSRLDPYEHLHLLFPVLLLSGYLDTALLFIAGIYTFRVLHRLRKHSANQG